MTWTEKSKNSTRPIRKIKSNVTRGSFPSTAQTKGDINKDVVGSASTEATRKEIEDKYGTREANSFTKKDKNSSNWTEV